MPHRRKLNDGTIITKVQHPLGRGHIYYVDGGPEGMVQIIDTYMVKPSIIAECLAWDLDIEEVKHPVIEFNKT